MKKTRLHSSPYGNGSASLNLTVGGSIKLYWATDSAYPDVVIPYDTPAGMPQKIIQREAILKMVEQGRITPDEGNALLEALGE